MKHLFIVISFLHCSSAMAQFDKVDIFFVDSPKAEELFNFFKATFRLPTVWDYQSYGPHVSSGGLTLGNVVIEFQKTEHTAGTEFKGMTLQPLSSAENTVTMLDAANVKHDAIMPSVFTLDNGLKDTTWEIVQLENLLPDNVEFLFCDYKHRNQIQKGRKDASDSLSLLRGGPLGILGVKDIVIACNNLSIYSNELLKLPGLKKENNSRFTFQSGPAMQLVNGDKTGIKKIVISVSSIAKVKKYLQSKSMLGGATKNSIFIDPQITDGLTIEFVDAQ